MSTTGFPSAHTGALAPTRMALPPPSSVVLDLAVRGTVVGWIDGTAVGFRGFGDASEALHAAWLAHRTVARRFARRDRRRPLPVDSEPLSLDRQGETEVVLAGGRPIAVLCRPDPAGRTGDGFGFELCVPPPADELTVRSTARLVYRTLRRSGIRWAMWTAPAARADATGADAAPAAELPASAPTIATATATSEAPAPGVAGRRRLAAAGVVLAAAIAGWLALGAPGLPRPGAGPVLIVVGAIVVVGVLVALASLGRLWVDSLLPDPPPHRAGGRASAPRAAAAPTPGALTAAAEGRP